MSGGLGNPPPDDGVSPGGVHGGPPIGPWRWIPDSPDPDDGSDHHSDDDGQLKPIGSGLRSSTLASKPRKTVHWQTPLTSIIPTLILRAPGGGADDNKFSNHSSHDDTLTNERSSLQRTMPSSMTSTFPTTTKVFKTDEHKPSSPATESVKIAGQPTITRLQTSTEQNVAATGQPTNSPPLNPDGPSENSTRQPPTVSTLIGLCTAADCMSSIRPTATEHDSVWLHFISSVRPECSSYDEHGTCLSSRRPTPTSYKTIGYTTSS